MSDDYEDDLPDEMQDTDIDDEINQFIDARMQRSSQSIPVSSCCCPT